MLIREWDRDLRGVVWTVVRSAHETDDVMQASYEKAFRSIDRFDGRASMKSWLHTICLRAAIDHVRYEGRRRHDDVTALVAPSASPDAAGAALAAVELDRAFESLDGTQRLLLMLTAGLGYGFDEVATIVGMPRGTVASKVSRARQQLREGSGQ